ncbi:MAG: glycosyltransferase family 2 protein [Paludibacteraceae bacterium]|nr:glycosyltransferase family 2 protein [Paludibacteraceae bacterium]
MTISVVIINYKVPEYLLQCLDALYKSLTGIESEVIVVDNHSQDDSRQWVTSYFPQVTWIDAPENLGFARANNIAIRQAQGQYVLLLNPDTIVSENCIRNVLAFAGQAENFGALGVRMIDNYGRFLPESKRNLPTLWSSFCKMFGIWRLMKRNPYYNEHLGEHDCGETPVLSGAFMLLNKQDLGDTVLLDKDFFMYGEDIDLSYRITKAGFKNYYFPETIVHYKGESAKKNSMTSVRTFYESMSIYYKKHYTNKFWYVMVVICVQVLMFFSYIYTFFRSHSIFVAREVVEYNAADHTYGELIRLIDSNKTLKRVVILHDDFSIRL